MVDMEEVEDIMVNMGEVGIMVEMVDTGEVMEVAMTVMVEMWSDGDGGGGHGRGKHIHATRRRTR